MTTKGPFVVEFFVTIDSFDYDCNQWNIFKLEYWNYTFGFVDSLLEENGCIIFIQGTNANFMGQLNVCAKGSFSFELKKKFQCINSISLHTKKGKVRI
jgi:hypothetical protein